MAFSQRGICGLEILIKNTFYNFNQKLDSLLNKQVTFISLIFPLSLISNPRMRYSRGCIIKGPVIDRFIFLNCQYAEFGYPHSAHELQQFRLRLHFYVLYLQQNFPLVTIKLLQLGMTFRLACQQSIVDASLAKHDIS